MATQNKPAEIKADEWADVAESSYAQMYVRGARVNVEEEVPAPIRERLELLYTQFAEDVEINGLTVKAGTPKYQDFDAKTPERANKFIELARRYGKYRAAGQLTVRAAVLKDNPTVVHFTMKPKEVREANRLPGSETKSAKK
jgi:hypothetical protein